MIHALSALSDLRYMVRFNLLLQQHDAWSVRYNAKGTAVFTLGARALVPGHGYKTVLCSDTGYQICWSPAQCPSTRSRPCTRRPRDLVLVETLYSGTGTVPEFWRGYLKKSVFTLVPIKIRSRAPCSGTKCERSLWCKMNDTRLTMRKAQCIISDLWTMLIIPSLDRYAQHTMYNSLRFLHLWSWTLSPDDLWYLPICSLASSVCLYVYSIAILLTELYDEENDPQESWTLLFPLQEDLIFDSPPDNCGIKQGDQGELLKCNLCNSRVTIKSWQILS